ncbi:hypothetical protein VTK56DRAFT_8225 [Thermocarpiscus australiensis]
MEKRSRFDTSTSGSEAGSQDLHFQSKIRSIRMVDSARIGATALALLMGLSVLGLSADTLRMHNDTQVYSGFVLSLWPDEFNMRPTVALVIGSAIVLVSNIVGLSFGSVRLLRAKTVAHTTVTFFCPLVGLTAALIAVIFFYAVNASETVDTFLSWTCRWRDIPMGQQPHWGTLCRQSYAGLYLAILLIPVEVIILGLAAFQLKLERYTERYAGARKSPVPS